MIKKIKKYLRAINIKRHKSCLTYSKIKFRKGVKELEKEISYFSDAKGKEDFKTKNHFGHKCYARELFIPKGFILTGKIHKFPTINILVKGDITLMDENGVRRVSAPYTFVSKGGVKKIGFAHEDCVFINVHGTKKTNELDVEKELTTNKFSEIPNLTREEKRVMKDIDSIGVKKWLM